MSSPNAALDSTPVPDKTADRLLKAAIVALTGVLLGLLVWTPGPQRVPQPGDPPAALSQIKTWLNPPPDTPPWMQGDRVDFAQLLGKVVVIDFWSSWCPECRAANVHLNALHERRNEGLRVIGVTMPDRFVTEAEILSYTEASVRFPVAFLGAADAISAYAIQTIPYAVIVGRDGTIKWTGKPAGPAFDQALETELASE